MKFLKELRKELTSKEKHPSEVWAWAFLLSSLLDCSFVSAGYEDPDEFTNIFPAAVDAIVYGKEYPVDESSVYERVMIYNLLGGDKDP